MYVTLDLIHVNTGAKKGTRECFIIENAKLVKVEIPDSKGQTRCIT